MFRRFASLVHITNTQHDNDGYYALQEYFRSNVESKASFYIDIYTQMQYDQLSIPSWLSDFDSVAMVINRGSFDELEENMFNSKTRIISVRLNLGLTALRNDLPAFDNLADLQLVNFPLNRMLKRIDDNVFGQNQKVSERSER